MATPVILFRLISFVLVVVFLLLLLQHTSTTPILMPHVSKCVQIWKCAMHVHTT